MDAPATLTRMCCPQMPGRKPAKKAPAKKALAKKAPAKKAPTKKAPAKKKKAKKAKKADAQPPAGGDAQPAGAAAAADMQTDGEGPQAAGAAADDAVQRFPFASLPDAVHDRIAAVSPQRSSRALLVRTMLMPGRACRR